MWVCLRVLGIVRKCRIYKSSVDSSLNYCVLPTEVHFPTPNPAIIKLSAFYQEQFTSSFKWGQNSCSQRSLQWTQMLLQFNLKTARKAHSWIWPRALNLTSEKLLMLLRNAEKHRNWEDVQGTVFTELQWNIFHFIFDIQHYNQNSVLVHYVCCSVG